MPIETRRFATIDAFLAAAGPFLEAREPEHLLSLGILGGMQVRGLPAGGALVLAEAAGRPVATAISTPGWNVVLSEIDDERAIAALAGALAGDTLGGVHAPSEHGEAFARAWCEPAGATWRAGMRQLSYALETVIPPRGVPGAMRRAGLADRDTMVRWMQAFDAEAMGAEAGRQDMVALVDDMLASPVRTGYVWEDGGRPVSMCQATGPTPHGIRIGAVYTPPEVRGRGYASALVAAVSQAQLDRGRRWCFLFTNADFGTSNRIYQAVGYRVIREVRAYHFDRR